MNSESKMTSPFNTQKLKKKKPNPILAADFTVQTTFKHDGMSIVKNRNQHISIFIRSIKTMFLNILLFQTPYKMSLIPRSPSL